MLWYRTKTTQIHYKSGGSTTHKVGHSVIVLSQPGCLYYYEKTKAYLHEKGVRFQEYNVDSSSEGRRLYNKYQGSGVLVVVINGTVIRVYSKQ